MNSKDLTRGDKQYLKGHGITEKQFDKMDEVSKEEWKDECKVGAYRKSYNHREAVGRLILKRLVGPNPEMVKIWEEKDRLIRAIKKKHKINENLSFKTIAQLKYILKNGPKEPEKEDFTAIRAAILKIKV